MAAKKITSPSNPLIKETVKLHTTKERKKQQLFIVEGIRAIQTFLEAGHTPKNFFVTEKAFPEAAKILPKTNPFLVSESVMKKLSTASTPSGILCVFPIPKTPALKTLGPGLVLAQISDPGNMGTLIRTAIALNKKTVVVVEGTDPWSPKVIQASAGTIAYASIFELSWQELVKAKGTLDLCGLVVKGGKSPQKIDATNSLLVVGSEAHGIPEAWLADCDSRMTLPMPGGIESLNAAVAGSIALYLSWFISQ